MDVALVEARFDPAAALAAFAAAHPQAGGIASFLGQVRAGEDDGAAGAVLALELTHYPPLTLPGMRDLAARVRGRWALAGLLIRHRIGMLAPGEPIVLVAAAARHRRAAIEACDCTIDHLKAAAWLWKREQTRAGWRWIDPRDQDHADLARWKTI